MSIVGGSDLTGDLLFGQVDGQRPRLRHRLEHGLRTGQVVGEFPGVELILHPETSGDRRQLFTIGSCQLFTVEALWIYLNNKNKRFKYSNVQIPIFFFK